MSETFLEKYSNMRLRSSPSPTVVGGPGPEPSSGGADKLTSPVTAEAAITTLLYRYAEEVDAGRFEGLATGLFAHARFVIAPPPAEPIDGPAMADLIARTTIRYADGTPRTRHVITNPIVTADEADGTATCRSYYTVMQQVEGFPLQPVVCGRYHDTFVRVDGEWRFDRRDYTLMDLVGDVSRHLRIAPAPAKRKESAE